MMKSIFAVAFLLLLTTTSVATATEKKDYTGTNRDGQREDVDTSKDK